MSINRVNISGNLTRDPELRSLPSGTQVLSFGVAVNDRVRNQTTGNWEDRPNYVDCVVFGNRAEPLNRFLSKGSKVAIEGKLRWSQWQDKQTGSNRSKLEVVVDQVEFLSPRDQDQQQGGYQPSASQGQGYQQPSYATPQAQPAPQPQQQAPQAQPVQQATQAQSAPPGPPAPHGPPPPPAPPPPPGGRRAGGGPGPGARRRSCPSWATGAGRARGCPRGRP